MRVHFDIRFVFGVLAGVAAIIWSTHTLLDLAQSPAHNIVVSRKSGAPVTLGQACWATFFGGALCLAAAFAFRPRQ